MLAPAALSLPAGRSQHKGYISPLPSAHAPPSLSLPRRGRRQHPSRCMCFAGACLANEKLLWIPLWAFQEGLARFLQSRHGKTVCFSKYIRDFSGAWLWQGLSAVVSQVVSLLGYTNRKVLSGVDTGLLGLYLSRVPAQIQPRLIASESCYLLTALPRSSRAHSNQRGLRRSFPAEDADPCTADTRAGSPRGEISRAHIIHRTPQSHHPILLHVPVLQGSGKATCC